MQRLTRCRSCLFVCIWNRACVKMVYSQFIVEPDLSTETVAFIWEWKYKVEILESDCRDLRSGICVDWFRLEVDVSFRVVMMKKHRATRFKISRNPIFNPQKIRRFAAKKRGFPPFPSVWPFHSRMASRYQPADGRTLTKLLSDSALRSVFVKHDLEDFDPVFAQGKVAAPGRLEAHGVEWSDW